MIDYPVVRVEGGRSMESAFTRLGRCILKDEGPRWRRVIATLPDGHEASQLLRLLRKMEKAGRRRTKARTAVTRKKRGKDGAPELPFEGKH
jgi:hypothetical protein